MASVLSLRPHSPLKRSFSDNPYFNSCSPIKDSRLAPFSDITLRNASACSLYTLGSSNKAADWLHGSENTPPLTSQSLLDLSPEKYGKENSDGYATQPRKRTCGIDRPPPSFRRVGVPSDLHVKKNKASRHVASEPPNCEQSSELVDIRNNKFVESDLFSFYEAIRVPLPEGRFSENDDEECDIEVSPKPNNIAVDPQPFKRWMSTLKRRHAGRRKDRHHTGEDTLLPVDGRSLAPLARQLPDSVRRASESISSSLGFVTAIKTASITIAGTSIAPPSDAGTNSKLRPGNRSTNHSEARKSFENHPLGPIMDESAWLRSLQRRKVVEELIASEESYIADLKVLINDYFMILTALPTLPGQTKLSIQNNISQILQLHEDLLADLHATVPQSDCTSSAHQENYQVTKAKHIRFHSADIMPGRMIEHKAARRLRHSLEMGRSPDRGSQGIAVDTKTAENIAKIFNKHMKRFFTYEEYGAHWTTMSQDLTTMCKGLHGWQEYERGVEALQKIVASVNNREAGSKKALSFPDLLIKPIQRVCKYPLLFEDLCRQTPVYDDPEAHAELEKALFRLQETIREVNKAKDDPKTRRLIEITWQLQDRLAFQQQKLSRALVFRLLGHVLLCGVLHVTYQSPDRIRGQYMVCVLYKSCLILATASRFHSPYTVVASVGLANGSIEESNNGRGLQCHTAPHTWKFVFEHNHRLYEVILSACTSHEEEVWKKQLRERIVYETHDFVEGQSNMHDMYTSLSLDLKSLGPVFGHANSLVRRMSMHRAATMGAKSTSSQVIIKNTQAQKLSEAPQPFSPMMVTRSQSHMSSNLVQILAPRRAERMRLENTLEDVWTKDNLPFPGMSNRRYENQIRASANSVMRKLSMASIASNFSRRSPSFSSMSNTISDDSFGSRVTQREAHGNFEAPSVADRRPAPAVVDFHNAPAAFLPTDFEVEDTRPASRRRRVGNRAVGLDRSSDKTQIRPKRVRRLSTHMLSLPRSESSARFMGRTTSRTSDTVITHVQERSTERAPSKKFQGLQRPEEKPVALRDASPNISSSKKYIKNKSKIFKFWI